MSVVYFANICHVAAESGISRGCVVAALTNCNACLSYTDGGDLP